MLVDILDLGPLHALPAPPDVVFQNTLGPHKGLSAQAGCLFPTSSAGDARSMASRTMHFVLIAGVIYADEELDGGMRHRCMAIGGHGDMLSC